jgi:hypothetical protein
VPENASFSTVIATQSSRVGRVQPTGRHCMQVGGLHPSYGRPAGPLDSNHVEEG